MPIAPPSDQQLRDLVEVISRCGSISAAARKVGMPRSTASSQYRMAIKRGIATGKEMQAKGEYDGEILGNDKKFEYTEEENKAYIYSVSDRIKTMEEALEKGKIDSGIWEPYKVTINSWEVGMRLKKPDGDDVHVEPLWQVKVWLQRRVPKIYTDTADMLIKRMSKHQPKYRALIRKSSVKDPHMLEISVFDSHFGKLAWAEETGEDYDLRIAEELYAKASESLVDKVRGFPIDKVVLPLGQDFFHIDNPSNTTINGTPQDVDSRYAKIFEAGCFSCIKAIDFLRGIAPVEVLYVPGNHDRTSAWHLVTYLQGWYNDQSDVTVNNRPKTRKYFSYGINLIGYTHGDEEKHANLPTIMAGEEPKLWAESRCREWHLGHFHKKKETAHLVGDTFGPVMVRILPSISATDAWHYRKGYQSDRAAEAYLFSKNNGYTGHFSVNVCG